MFANEQSRELNDYLSGTPADSGTLKIPFKKI